MKPTLKLLLLTLYLFSNDPVFCQAQKDSDQITVLAAAEGPNAAPRQKVVNDRYGFLTDLEFTLSISVLLFGTLVLCLEVYLIKIKQIGHEYISKIVLVTLIVTGTLFLITAGYNNNQIAPATGLLGTIAGYLLGRSSGPDKTVSKTDKDE